MMLEENILENNVRGPRWTVIAYREMGVRFAIKDLNELEVPIWVRKGLAYDDVIKIEVERER